jgi:hypothetical protein
MLAIGGYFRTLCDRFGKGWNRFWFAPSDPLTLGVIRILTALVALGLYLTYLPDLERLFVPEGLLSRDAMLRIRGDIPIFSMFDYATSSSALWFFYWAGAVALALMLVGLFTRATAILALVAVLSLIHRGPVLARPVDEIVAMLMFYLCLGPCGRTLSLDALLKRRGAGSRSTAAFRPLSGAVQSSAATISIRLMQIHVTAIYVAMAVAKLRGVIWWDGSAVWDLLVRPDWPLIHVSGRPNEAEWYLINAWTLAIVAFELCFAVLIWNRLARPLLLGISLFMWLGTAILTGMVSFAFIMLVANLAFVPSSTFRGYRQRNTRENRALTGGAE